MYTRITIQLFIHFTIQNGSYHAIKFYLKFCIYILSCLGLMNWEIQYDVLCNCLVCLWVFTACKHRLCIRYYIQDGVWQHEVKLPDTVWRRKPLRGRKQNRTQIQQRSDFFTALFNFYSHFEFPLTLVLLIYILIKSSFI